MNIIEKFEKLIEKIWFKRLLVSVLIGVTTVGYATEYSANIHNEISSNVIRLHIIANSDSEYDQSIKFMVRDKVTAYLADKLADTDDINTAKEIINDSIADITNVAKEITGYYDVNAVTGIYEFPTKSYGTASLPAGNYYALRIIIGEGEGENWWCVLYPKLCFMELNQDDLKTVLSNEAYAVITENDRIEYKFKFKILELLKK